MRHLADDSLSNDEAPLQCGVGVGGDADVGVLHLDSDSGYVCTLDFPSGNYACIYMSDKNAFICH